MKPHNKPIAAKKMSWSRDSSGRTERRKYNPAPATARKMPRRLAELSPKFTIAALPSQIYVSELHGKKIARWLGRLEFRRPGRKTLTTTDSSLRLMNIQN